MRKRTKIIIGLAALCAGTLVFGACSSNRSPYPEFAEAGYDFSVCFDANGGKAAGKQNSSIVNVYSSERVRQGVKLYAPDDTGRGPNNFYNVERNGYFLAGWYAVREARVDENGTPLDEEGNPCTVEGDLYDAEGNIVYDEDGNPQKAYYSEYGKPQGYSYAEKWDFDTLLTRDDFVYEEGAGYAFTLYAAWVPEFSFELQGQEREWMCEKCNTSYYQETQPERCTASVETDRLDSDGNAITEPCGGTVFIDKGMSWYTVSSYRYNPQFATEEDKTLTVPAWNDETGVLEYGKLSGPSDRTLLSVYASEADWENETNALGSLQNNGTWDEATATATKNVSRYYASWENGLWYRIRTKEQLAKNKGTNRCYNLLADLEYDENDEWPFGVGSSYGGIFRGNNHTISGVVINQDNSSDDTRGGLFGTITASARFEDITFENITCNINQASRRSGAMFGLFAGELSAEATMTNVKVTGTLFIGDGIYVDRGFNPDTGMAESRYPYDIGLLSGNFVTCGISLSGITLKVDNKKATVTDPATGEIEIS